jgi:hypothetical protein
MTKKISIEELYDFYMETLKNCGRFILNESDVKISYHIFEQFDIGVITFLHNETLNKLYDADFINNQQLIESQQLRKKVLELQKEDKWNIHFVKTSLSWKMVLDLSDKIRNSFQ